jgi:hypothetical protein
MRRQAEGNAMGFEGCIAYIARDKTVTITLQFGQLQSTLGYDVGSQLTRSYMKKSLCALLLATAGAVHAAPINISFTYEGAYYTNDDDERYWQPDATLSATFTGEDLNGDAVIEKSEVTSLFALGIDFFTPNTANETYTISEFSYRNTSDFSIKVSYNADYSFDDTLNRWNDWASWGPKWQYWGNSSTSLERYNNWSGTEDTVATVVSSVPEPTTVAMLGLGLSIIGLSRRRIKAVTR